MGGSYGLSASFCPLSPPGTESSTESSSPGVESSNVSSPFEAVSSPAPSCGGSSLSGSATGASVGVSFLEVTVIVGDTEFDVSLPSENALGPCVEGTTNGFSLPVGEVRELDDVGERGEIEGGSEAFESAAGLSAFDKIGDSDSSVASFVIGADVINVVGVGVDVVDAGADVCSVNNGETVSELSVGLGSKKLESKPASVVEDGDGDGVGLSAKSVNIRRLSRGAFLLNTSKL